MSSSCTGARSYRVAVVGSGPAGLFAAARLADLLPATQVDVIDRLLTPYGLVRHGVAPDHPAIKSVTLTLQRILELGRVRFMGAVELGRDVSCDDLARCYDAVIFATGAPSGRRLGIPGEELPGVLAASDLVRWYNGHPDAVPLDVLCARTVLVVGAGNVALDVARFFTREVAQLTATDIPDGVVARLRGRATTEVHVVARRGAPFTRFSNKELRELGMLAGVGILVDPRDVGGGALAGLSREAAANLALFRDWASRGASGERRVHLHFSLRPVAVVGNGRAEALRAERVLTLPDGTTRNTGQFTDVPADLIVRSAGNTAAPLPGLPFDPARGVVPNDHGRILTAAGRITPGRYVTGWLKRGATGVIGTNKPDAHETVDRVVEDLTFEPPPRPSLESLLRATGREWSEYRQWLNIDAAEARLGAGQGRSRAKIADWTSLRQAASQPATAPGILEGV